MPTAYLSPSQLQDLTNVSSNAPGSGDNGKALVWNWNSTTGTGQWQAQQVAYSNLSGAPPLPIPVASGGTGTQTGSITGTGALTFAAGGTNQNVNLVPSGTGFVTFNAASLGQDFSAPGIIEIAGLPRPPIVAKLNQQVSVELFTASSDTSVAPVFYLTRSRGTVASPEPVHGTDRLCLIGAAHMGANPDGSAIPSDNLTGFFIEVDGSPGVVTVRNPPTRQRIVGVNSAGHPAEFLSMNSIRCRIPQGTESENTTSGALQVSGGAGITGNLHVGGTINGLGAVQSGAPSGPTAAGTAGQIRWDADYIYVCTQSGSAGNAAWKRVAISTWTP